MSEASVDTLSPALTPTIKRRLACGLYEGIVLFGVSLVPAVLSTALLNLLGDTLAAVLATQLVGFLCYGAYFTWLWTRTGQTLPMQTWRIRLVRAEDGALLKPAHAWWRYTLCWLWVAPPVAIAWLAGWHKWSMMAAIGVWALGYALLARRLPRQQFLHDVLAGTQLVTAPAATGPAAR